ncbi:MAG: C-terminal helicase domain-containing protein, partial [Acidaminobacteraceae bacterium]
LSGDLSATPDKLISESPKLQETLNIIDSIKLKGEKVIIFTKLRNMQSILRRVIYYKYKIDPIVINGQTKENRNVLISNFSNIDGFNIIVLSPKAAGVGLNITAANHVIHYTRDWNPAVEKQATDRTFRIGQKKDVKVYYPIVGKEAFETVEEKLDKLLEKKKALIDQVVVSKEQFKELDNDMMEILFE